MIYIVSGMHRTGTSMMMRALIAGGIRASYDERRNEILDLRRRDNYDPNPNGLYELDQRRLSDGFPDEFDGTLIKVFDTQWDGLCAKNTKLRIVYMRRPQEAIERSLAAFNGREKTGDISARWNRQREIVDRLASMENVVALDEVWYDTILEKPLAYFEALADRGWPINPWKSMLTIRPEYRHF